MGIIYKATNKINGKGYIGVTIQSLGGRKRQHEKGAKNTYGFRGALYKYGARNFMWEVLEECLVEQFDEKEVFYIEKYNTFASGGHGYNLTKGGRHVFGASGKYHYLNRMSPEERELWLENNRIGKNNGMYGNGDLIAGENHFLNKMTENEREECLNKIRGENNYQSKMTKEELKNKCWLNWWDEEKKKIWIEKNLKGKNNPFVKHAYKYRGKNSCHYGKRGFKSPLSKKFIITFPDNKEYIINLIEFCKSYKEVKLLSNGLNRVANGYLEKYKGFKCRHYNQEIDYNIDEWKYYENYNN